MVRSTREQLGLVGIIAALLIGGCLDSRRPAGQLQAGQSLREHLPPRVSASPDEPWPRTFTDDMGNTVTFRHAPRRIITLQPNLAEILALVGALHQLVGVTEFCEYPPEAAAKPKIGGIINPSLEAIVGLRPGLVLVSRGNDMAFIKRLPRLGINALGYDPQDLPDVMELVRCLGEVTGHEDQAEQAAQDLEERYAAVVQQGRRLSLSALRVLFVLSWEPLFVAGATSFVDDMITAGGGQNAVRQMASVDRNSPWPQVSREAVVAANPQVIISSSTHDQSGAAEADRIRRRLQADAAWKHVAAVSHGQIYMIDDDLVTIPGPRLIDGLEEISQLLARAGAHYREEKGRG